MKILIIGYCPQRFMNPVAQQLHQKGHTVDLMSFTRFDIPKEDATFYRSIQNGRTPTNVVYKIFRLFIGCFLYGGTMCRFILRESDLSFYEKLRSALKGIVNYPLTSQIQKYNLVNIQLMGDYDAFYPFLKDSTRVICSYWGSDLLQATEQDLLKQKKWLAKASYITVQSTELEKLLVEKHAELSIATKVRKTLYPVNQDIFQTILQNMGNKKEHDKTVITLGYNGSQNQNHLPILDQIDTLSKEVKGRIKLYIHMSYGGTEEYVLSVKNRLDQLAVEYELKTNFITDEAIATKRIDSDIFIHLPTTDAFCAALSESLIAGNIVITGDWLPYSLYDEADVHFHKISTIEKLSATLLSIMGSLDKEKGKSARNHHVVLDIVDRDKAITNWVRILTAN